MPIFFTEEERLAVRRFNTHPVLSNLYWGLVNRARAGAETPGFQTPDTNTQFYHNFLEYATAAVVGCSLVSDELLKARTRHFILETAELPVDEWVGPSFRNHSTPVPTGHLETSHLAIGVALALDIVPNIFTADEQKVLETALREKAIPLCLEWLSHSKNIANWASILLAGLAVSAAVLKDEANLAVARRWYDLLIQGVQPDGSYGETVQYSGYCYHFLMLTHEALLRSGQTGLEMPYAKSVHWYEQMLLYIKPLAGWGELPRPRMANFGDAGAICGPDPDLLMHIAARAKDTMPEEAALARRLFDDLYAKIPAQGPFDRASFGFLNRYGLFSLSLFPASAEPAPALEHKPLSAFSNGDAIAHTGNTSLAFRFSSSGMYAAGHLHGDVNSIILAHRKERLLVDPGHCCYRNLAHAFNISSASHNTCTFLCSGSDWAKTGLNELRNANPTEERAQPFHLLRPNNRGDGIPADPVPRGGKFLLATRKGRISVIGNDAAALYGDPISKFERFAILAGEHTVFIIDRIDTSAPVKTIWHWLFNNRDGQLEWKFVKPEYRLVVRRGEAGMKLFHLGDGSKPRSLCPSYSYVHDAYHPLPDQPGEGHPGSGLLFDWIETEARTGLRTKVHVFAVDAYGPVSAWHIRTEPHIGLKAFDEDWELQQNEDSFVITELNSKETATLRLDGGNWTLI
ncbi:MAG: heparinase II/III family protein [Victivallales bacterium]|nr:heparinase II/III family protein [Victivallales bacterium]